MSLLSETKKVLKRKAIMVDADQIQTETQHFNYLHQIDKVVERMKKEDEAMKFTLNDEINQIKKTLREPTIISILKKPNIKHTQIDMGFAEDTSKNCSSIGMPLYEGDMSCNLATFIPKTSMRSTFDNSKIMNLLKSHTRRESKIKLTKRKRMLSTKDPSKTLKFSKSDSNFYSNRGWAYSDYRPLAFNFKLGTNSEYRNGLAKQISTNKRKPLQQIYNETLDATQKAKCDQRSLHNTNILLTKKSMQIKDYVSKLRNDSIIKKAKTAYIPLKSKQATNILNSQLYKIVKALPGVLWEVQNVDANYLSS